MKPWNAWVACLGCAGLCLALVGCGGDKAPESDLGDLAAQGGVASPPPSAPPAVAQKETQPAPAESTPAPAPAPAPEAAPVATPAPVASETATAPPKPEEPVAKTESLAIDKPAADAPKATENPAAMPNTPAAATPANPETAPASTAATPVAESKPNSSPAAEADNPFAVFETQPTTPAARTTTPASGTADAGSEGTPAVANPPAQGDRPEGALGYLNSAGGSDRGSSSGLYHSPVNGAMAFLDAVKEKNLAKIAEALALHAPLEAKSTANQKLFAAILDQDLAQEDLDEFAKQLDGYQLAGSNVAKSTGQFGVIVTKPEGNRIVRRTITMRHEKAGWKVQDISGKGEIERPVVMPRMRGRR